MGLNLFHFQNIASFRIIWHQNVKLHKKLNFSVKLVKTGFVANDNWRQAPCFDLLHHKCFIECNLNTSLHLLHRFTSGFKRLISSH